MATSSNLISALGAGSGVDVKALAEGLVEAERAPRKERIESRLEKSEARISGYGALKYALSDFRAAVEKLNDASDFGQPKVANTQPTSLGVTANGSATPGAYVLEVSQLARAQRSVSVGFANLTDSLNNGAPFKLDVSINDATAVSIDVLAGQDKPEAIVSAINSAGLGLSAQILRTGEGSTPYAIVVTGQEGATRKFTIQSTASAVQFGLPAVTAADAKLSINGVPVSRATNKVSDLIPGVTLDLYAPTPTGGARVDFSRDLEAVKQNIQNFVKAYNDLDTSLTILADPKSEVEDLGGSLAGDPVVRTVRAQMRNLLSSPSSTAGSVIKSASDLGLAFDQNGKLTLQEGRWRNDAQGVPTEWIPSKLDQALDINYADVVKMFSAGTSNKSVYNDSPAGVAGDMVLALDRLTRSTGLIASRTESANLDKTRYSEQLTKLEERMAQLLERYTRQFSIMESLVGNTNAMKTSLKSSFEGMMAAYK